MGRIEDTIAALDRLIAALRSEQELRLASVLHQQLHRAAWSNRSELFTELGRLLRNAQASHVSTYSSAIGLQIEKILTAMDGL